MEAFSLLKYWRTSGGGDEGRLKMGGGLGDANANNNNKATTAAETQTLTSSVTAVAYHGSETEEEDEDGDDGPFFDLEFTVPEEDYGDDDDQLPQEQARNHEEQEQEEEYIESYTDDDDGDKEFNFTLSSSSASSSSNNDHTVQNLSSLSPSDDLFFKGKLVPIEPSSSSSDTDPNTTTTTTTKHSSPQFPVSLLKSATKLRVFMLGLKKPKPNSDKSTTEPAASNIPSKNPENTHEDDKKNTTSKNKSFTVKFKVEEVPIVSLFTRDNSSKNGHKSSSLSNKHNISEESAGTTDEKKFSKEVMLHKYLKKVKPLYVHVSKKYGEKLRFSGQLSLGGQQLKVGPKRLAEKTQQTQQGDGDSHIENESTTKGQLKQGGAGTLLPARLKIVCKQLGKSRSASSAVVAAQPHSGTVSLSSQRRDDSLLQQQDGIQSAILHCKRSFNASRAN